MAKPTSPSRGFWRKARPEIIKLHDDHPEGTASWAWVSEGPPDAQIVLARWQGVKRPFNYTFEGVLYMSWLPDKGAHDELLVARKGYTYRSSPLAGELAIAESTDVGSLGDDEPDQIITITAAGILVHDALKALTPDDCQEFLGALIRRTSGEDRVELPGLDN